MLKCFEYVKSETRRFSNKEYRQSSLLSTEASVGRNKYGESIRTVGDTLRSNTNKPYDSLEAKYSKEALKEVFALLPKKELAIFKTIVLSDLTEFQIAEKYGLSTEQVEVVAKKVLKQIYDEAGQEQYERFAKKVFKTKARTLGQVFKDNLKFVTPKQQKILKQRLLLGVSPYNVVVNGASVHYHQVYRAVKKMAFLCNASPEQREEAITHFEIYHKNRKLVKAIIKEGDFFWKFLSEADRKIFNYLYVEKKLFQGVGKVFGISQIELRTVRRRIISVGKKYFAEESKQRDLYFERNVRKQESEELLDLILKREDDFLSLLSEDDYKFFQLKFVEKKYVKDMHEDCQMGRCGLWNAHLRIFGYAKIYYWGSEEEKQALVTQLKDLKIKEKLIKTIKAQVGEDRVLDLVEKEVADVFVKRHIENKTTDQIMQEMNITSATVCRRNAKVLDIADKIFNGSDFEREKIISRLKAERELEKLVEYAIENPEATVLWKVIQPRDKDMFVSHYKNAEPLHLIGERYNIEKGSVVPRIKKVRGYFEAFMTSDEAGRQKLMKDIAKRNTLQDSKTRSLP